MPRDQLDDMLDALTPILKPIVEAIEKEYPTTKDHYGYYMRAIPEIAKKSGEQNPERKKHLYIAIGVCLQRAGANKNGVNQALRQLGCV